MRIALLPSAYAPAIGGVEVLTGRLAQQLIAGGDEVEVWTLRHPEDLPEDEQIAGIRVRRFVLPLPPARLTPVLHAPLGALKGLAALARASREFRPDVLHVQCFSNNGVYGALAAAVSRRPLVVTLQGETFMDDHDLYDRSVLLRAGLRAGLRRAAAVTGCSGFVLADARRFGLGDGVGRVIFNGVDGATAGAPDPLPVRFARYVLGVGRVVPKKGFDLLIEAWSKLAPQHPGVGLVVAGGGAEVDRLRRLAEERGVAGSVELTGPMTQPQVASLMAQAEVFVMPSRVEPFGIVVLEAMRAGKPVVVSSRGGAGEFVTDGREGLVVDPFDAAALAAAIGGLLDDEALRATMGQEGRARAMDFEWPRIAEEYRTVYRMVAPA